MPGESLPNRPEIADLKTLSPQSRMARLLEIFDLAKTTDKNAERKEQFLKLAGDYCRSVVESRVRSANEIADSDTRRAAIHNQIMKIITTMSLSVGLAPDQRKLTEYLVSNRDEVERMITSYFANYDTANPQEHSELREALRGSNRFAGSPERE